jgi:hypothetical protein
VTYPGRETLAAMHEPYRCCSFHYPATTPPSEEAIGSRESFRFVAMRLLARLALDVDTLTDWLVEDVTAERATREGNIESTETPPSGGPLRGFPNHEDDCHCHEAVRLFGAAPPSGGSYDLADAFTWFHVRTTGGCSESHRSDAAEYARLTASDGDREP